MKTKSSVLIVEDDTGWATITEELLTRKNFECYVASTYDDAITVFRDKNPRVLVLDLKLDNDDIQSENWDGWKLAHAAKKHNTQTIVLTAHSNIPIIKRAFKDFDVADFFSKKDFFENKAIFIQRVNDAIKTRNIFISYSHQDSEWLGMLTKSLNILTKNNPIKIWNDTKIKRGSKWKVEIDRALAMADAAILMVTPDFLASDFIDTQELPVLLEAAEKKELKILWIAVKHSLVEETVIAEYQAVNNPKKPLAMLNDKERDKEIVIICKTIKEAISE